MADVSRDGTGEGLSEFFDYLADKGLMNKSTAGARKTAALKVLSIDEDWENIDLRALDLDEQFERFARLHKQDYKPNSLAVYESRFKKAVTEYLTYLDDPTSFKAPTAKPSGKRSSGNDDTDGKGASGSESEPEEPEAAAPQTAGASDGQTAAPHQKLITYPFPLRGAGTMAYLQLPPDLRADEASRLGRFLESLAIPDESPE